jgi:hypothetical protein
MVWIVKSEWHSVEKRYSAEIDESLLSEIYPDKDEDEIATMLQEIADGEADLEQILGDAFGEVDIDWDWLDEDDWWTDRKGGYDITYEVQ